MRQLMHAIVMEGKNFIYRRDFPIETPQLVEAALEEGQKASYKLNALLDIQKRLEELGKVRDAPRAREILLAGRTTTSCSPKPSRSRSRLSRICALMASWIVNVPPCLKVSRLPVQ